MATFGDINVEATVDGNPANNLLGCKFTMPASGLITQISAYLGLANGAKAKAAIYSDVAGVCTTLLASSSNEVTGDGNWQWFNFTVSYNGVAGTDYWLIVNNDTFDATLFVYHAGAVNQWQCKDPNPGVYGTFPAIYPDPPSFYFAREQSIYATYTPAGAPKGTIAIHAKLANII